MSRFTFFGIGTARCAGIVLAASAILACGAASADAQMASSTSSPAVEKPAQRHVFSMSCKVTSLNGALATSEGRERAIAWWRRHHFTALWLESYRHGERVETPRLVALRDAFRKVGFETRGLVTPTMLNDAGPDGKVPMVVCWSDPKARQRLTAECLRAADVFDTVILDDFLFSHCGAHCARCAADKHRRGIADWTAYRCALMYEVCEKDILGPVHAAHPKATFIIKYPCWYKDYAASGYDPVRQNGLFGACWIGTETRDANPNPLQACWIMDWMDRLSRGRCGGGWYDGLDSTPEKFIEQAYYTILGGARESLVHCYDYLLADDPGKTPFGEKVRRAGACARAFERESDRLQALGDFLAGAERLAFEMGTNGVSRHRFRKDGKMWLARLNTTGSRVEGLPPHGFDLTVEGTSARTVMNIVNFVRGCEPRNPKLDLARPIAEEIALNTKYHLPNTILLQYDAMLRPDIMRIVRTAETNLTEYGVWIEMARPLVERCGITWRGRKGWDWDWFINPGFLMAYTHDERARLVDEIFRLFKAEFGAYPKSVGSWLLDAWSMDYMQKKYGVKGFCICREQDNTDAYGLRGGYFNGLYYPSRKNMLSAAVDMRNAIRAPVFKMLTPDPIYNYAKSVAPKGMAQVPSTLEPVWHSGYTPAVVDWYFRVYTGPGRLGLSYMQTGQENSFGWDMIGKGLPYQIEQIAKYRQAGKIDVERMCDTAERFIREHPENCPQTQVALEDWAGDHRSVWYNSRHYRANLLLDGDALRLRDIHKMCDDFEEPFLDKVCTGWQALYFTPPVVDEYLFKTDGRFKPWSFSGRFEALSVDTPNAETLVVTAKGVDRSDVRVTFAPDGIVVSGAPDFTADGATNGVQTLEFDGFRYTVRHLRRGSKSGESAKIELSGE